MSILVIADDLTGAAEIGGMAWRYGLSAEIVHTLTKLSDRDVQILNTNTRSLKTDEALAHLEELFDARCRHWEERWDWIYLKFDSALRGHIAREIPFYREVFRKKNVVFCPVNPTLDRVIGDGRYWIGGKPIAETDFARDPEFPVTKSGVLEAIGADSWSLVEEPTDLPAQIPWYTVAAVGDESGLHRWASANVSFGMYAGAAAFFEALLRQQVGGCPVDKGEPPLPQNPALYICGSNHENSVQRIASVDTDKVVYWTYLGTEKEVAEEICRKIKIEGKVILAVAPAVSYDAQVVREQMAQVVAICNQQCTLRELIIEGGATAHAILEILDIDTLLPVWEYGQGVIRNRVPETALTITLKPGSYPWTEKLWVFGK